MVLAGYLSEKHTRLAISAALLHLFDGDVRGKFAGGANLCLVVGDGVRLNKGDVPNNGGQLWPAGGRMPAANSSVPGNAAGHVLGGVWKGAGELGDRTFVLSFAPRSDASFS